ncbi:BLUF domain-containing protein [Psychrobacter sp. LV10R520-6]|uniref:BLUF domain-containing protein n=1 Tax=Psychrobacter sp. LV10R520-6 TaxID=1415574 RepID=UPI0024CD6022|nr:BLUF domain-containing protein [Psychrobacter sp. LV10R520-6]SNT70316.1 Sensors of blue-light using FAD [Psychrobacter sp. LV10R520-6]
MSSINNNSANPVITELYQLVYISRITSTGLSGASTLNDIAKISVKNNKADDITGVLCYGNGYFFQCIEGSEQALTNLKNRLLLDDRHKYLQILEFSEIDKRRFTRWSMRSIILERWMTTDPKVKALMPFKPYSWSNEQGRQFLDFLQGYYEEQKNMGKVHIDDQPVKYSALGLTLSKVMGQHQAFFLIQSVLGALIVLTLLWFMLS